MRIKGISAVAFAFALSAGTAAACTMEAAAECGGMDKAKETVANVSTASADCAAACSAAKATQTVADSDADSLSTPGGGVEAQPASTDSMSAGSESEEDDAKVGYELGEKVENFTLKQAQTGETRSLEELAGEKATVVIFWNNLCPWVEGGPHAAADRVEQFADEYADKGVSVFGIDPGVDKSEQDLIQYASTKPFPILMNRDSSIAARFNAQYTPHTFVLDSDMNVIYQGGYDSGARRDEDGNVVPWAQNAVDDYLAGQEPEEPNMRGVGCSIKWAPGARPST